MKERLANKVAIVLGAGGRDNMGQAIARRFAHEGAQVIVAGRDEQELRWLSETICSEYVLCDITSRRDLDQLVAFAVDRFGGLDIAVNCVGWALFKPFLETTQEELDQMIDIQFKGPFQFFQSVLTKMRNGGSAIQIGSISSECLFPDHAAYMGTKAGMDHVIRSLANDFGSRNIRVNTISPGLTDTPMTADLKTIPGLVDLFLKQYPLGRYGTTDEVAATAAWLSSDECFMTGQTLRVEGGMSLRGFPVAADINKLLNLDS